MTHTTHHQDQHPAPRVEPRQYGVLFSHAHVDTIGPDLVGRPYEDQAQARAAGDRVRRAQPGIGYALMTRPDPATAWTEVGTGRTAHEVIAARWCERISRRIAHPGQDRNPRPVSR